MHPLAHHDLSGCSIRQLSSAEAEVSSIHINSVADQAYQLLRAQVFLMSLKAGGVALNLTAASHVMLMDPWWNPAVEQQVGHHLHELSLGEAAAFSQSRVSDKRLINVLESAECRSLHREDCVSFMASLYELSQIRLKGC